MNSTVINPVLPGDRPDPAVLKDGEDYWLTWSSFEAAPGLAIWHSRDLVNWRYVGSALERPLGSTFAVDIAKHGDRYFIYIPFIPAPWSQEITEPSIYVIHAPSMEGPWSEPIDLGIRGAIDPGHAVGEDGKRYLFTNGIRRVQLTDDGLATVGELEKVYDGWQYPEEWVTEAYALEGPKLLRRGEWFYMVSAVGGTSGPPTGHMVIAARARSIDGPWENSPANPVARTWDASERWWSRGHATLVEGPGGDWWMVSHAYENGYRTSGRQILLESIVWNDDCWPVAPAADLAAALSAPARQEPRPAVFEDAFTEVQLGEHWTFHGASPDERERLAAGEDGLRVAASGHSPADSSPLVILAGDHAYEVEVELELDGDGVEAGLLLFFNHRLFCGMGVTADRMISYSGGQPTHWREPYAPARSVTLRIVNDRHIVTGWYRAGGEWVRHAIRYEVSGYHANTMGDLQSLRPAIYASGEGAARFRRFTYRRLSDER
ncbi:family 43 glycosylhydrolase [Micrococcus luteus]